MPFHPRPRSTHSRLLGAAAIVLLLCGVAAAADGDARGSAVAGVTPDGSSVDAGATPDGSSVDAGAAPIAPRLTAQQRAAIERLRAIGYVTGQMPLREQSGVIVHDRERAAPGFNLFVSGHAPELLLIDMDGRVLHRWSKPYDQIWPGFEVSRQHKKTIGYYRRAHLYPNGDVLVIVNGVGIAKLDRDSNVLWANGNRAHHDLDVAANGDIYVLTCKAHVVPRIGAEPILEDFVTVLDADGHEKRSVSLLEAFENGETSRELLAEMRLGSGVVPFDGDIFHTNTVSVLYGRAALANSLFRAGRILTSVRHLNAIALVDLDRRRAVWTHRGSFRGQHDPEILADGHLLLFDNQTRPPSRVLEIDPGTMKVVWSFTGSSDVPLFSPFAGAAQRLRNGNTLITESMPGRVIEVTREGEVVWEYLNPYRASGADHLVAQIPEMVRLAPDFPLDWVSDPPQGERR